MKRCKSLISMCALAALTNCTKADVVSAQEHLDENGNLKSIVLHNDSTAAIGSVKTPWMFVRPEGNSGFANDFTTNAISVVSEDGVNYYAHTEKPGTNRTQVIHFTINEDGIPSKQGNVINVAVDGNDEMKKRKLVGVTDRCLWFYPTDQYGTSFVYNLNNNEGSIGEQKVKCLAAYQDKSKMYVLCNFKEDNEKTKLIQKIGMGSTYEPFTPLSDDKEIVMARNPNDGCVYTGDSVGNVTGLKKPLNLLVPISSITISDNGHDVFVTSTATNIYFNVGLSKPWRNAVYGGENASVKPMPPKPNDGLIRIIDNRKNGGKLMYVTKKGIHTFDD